MQTTNSTLPAKGESDFHLPANYVSDTDALLQKLPAGVSDQKMARGELGTLTLRQQIARIKLIIALQEAKEISPE